MRPELGDSVGRCPHPSRVSSPPSNSARARRRRQGCRQMFWQDIASCSACTAGVERGWPGQPRERPPGLANPYRRGVDMTDAIQRGPALACDPENWLTAAEQAAVSQATDALNAVLPAFTVACWDAADALGPYRAVLRARPEMTVRRRGRSE